MADAPTISDDDIVQDVPTKKPSPVEAIFETAQMRLIKKVEASAPSRTRRTSFVFGSWGLSFVATVYLSLRGGDGAIAKAAVDGFTSYMMAVATMYIVGYSVDNADFINKAKTALANRVGGEQ